MKKRFFAVMAVVLFTGSLLNMSSLSIEESGGTPEECFTWADRKAKRDGFIHGWTYQQEYEAFIILYDMCVAGTLPGQQITES